MIPGLGRSAGGGHGYPLQCSCLENPHGLRSLADYSPWSYKELETTELLSTAHRGIKGFPGGSAVKNPPVKAGAAGSIPGSGKHPAEGNGNPLQ